MHKPSSFIATRPALVAIGLACCTASALAQQVFPAPKNGVLPKDDAFYATPTVDELAGAAPGTVLRYRTVTAKNYSTVSKTYQLMFRSTDSHGRPVGSVTTVLIPNNLPLLGRKMLSYQAFYDGLTLNCSPSYTTTRGTLMESWLGFFRPALKDGLVVNLPDYEGLESQWTAGINSGQGVLDSIRAVQNFKPAGLPGTSTPVVLMGYSGGALASAWANELAPSYAPELNIKGAAFGGVPVNLGNVGKKVDGGLFSGLYLGSVAGLARAYKDEIDVNALANEKGKQALTEVGEMCLLSELTGTPDMLFKFAFKRVADYVTVPDLLAVPEVQAIIQKNLLGQRAPKAPMYIFEGVLDEIMPIADVDKLVQNYCDQGIKVQYNRIATGDHIFSALSSNKALAFLMDRLANKAIPSTCK